MLAHRSQRTSPPSGQPESALRVSSAAIVRPIPATSIRPNGPKRFRPRSVQFPDCRPWRDHRPAAEHLGKAKPPWPAGGDAKNSEEANVNEALSARCYRHASDRHDRAALREPSGRHCRQGWRRHPGRQLLRAATDWKLKLSPENGRIEVEFEIDQNINGQIWNVRLKRNGNVFFTGPAHDPAAERLVRGPARDQQRRRHRLRCRPGRQPEDRRGLPRHCHRELLIATLSLGAVPPRSRALSSNPGRAAARRRQPSCWTSERLILSVWVRGKSASGQIRKSSRRWMLAELRVGLLDERLDALPQRGDLLVDLRCRWRRAGWA